MFEIFFVNDETLSETSVSPIFGDQLLFQFNQYVAIFNRKYFSLGVVQFSYLSFCMQIRDFGIFSPYSGSLLICLFLTSIQITLQFNGLIAYLLIFHDNLSNILFFVLFFAGCFFLIFFQIYLYIMSLPPVIQNLSNKT